MLKGVLFLIGSAGLVYVSRASLRTPGSHGFYRFFAWEALLSLFLVNVRSWFDRPFSLQQLVSWSLLLVSLYLVVQGVTMLSRQGRPDEERRDPGLAGIEKTTRLVTGGIYGAIRHPLYSSLLFLGWGIFFKQPSLQASTLAIVSSVFLWTTARVEEGENLRYFGEVYRIYIRRTKMFVPFVL